MLFILETPIVGHDTPCLSDPEVYAADVTIVEKWASGANVHLKIIPNSEIAAPWRINIKLKR